MPDEEDALAELLKDPKNLALIKKYNSAKGKRGGAAGGKARAESLTPEQRKAIASKAGAASALKKKAAVKKAAAKKKRP